MVEHDNSCRNVIVGVDNVLYYIPGHEDGHWSRYGPEVSGGVVKFSPRWRLLIMAQTVNKCEDNCWKI